MIYALLIAVLSVALTAIFVAPPLVQLGALAVYASAVLYMGVNCG